MFKVVDQFPVPGKGLSVKIDCENKNCFSTGKQFLDQKGSVWEVIDILKDNEMSIILSGNGFICGDLTPIRT